MPTGEPGRRAAVDIGGTFTDLVAVGSGGELIFGKAPTTPAALEEGVLRTLADAGVNPGSLSLFVHGTTIVVNAITERRGARTALITTRGFRDVLEIGRANRPDLYNLSYRKPVPMVPRRLRFEVTERMSYRGEVLEPLAEEEIESVAGRLRDRGTEAVAVCFLHSWANPEHERRARDLLVKLLPDAEVVASHEVSRQWREYERFSTAVLSAYVKPVVAGYLRALRDRLRTDGFSGSVRVMRSNGGLCSVDRAVVAPVSLLESGPVAGVTAAALLGRRRGASNVLALDVGGTTAKTSAVREGRARVETVHHIERTPRFAGYPVQVPVVEIVEIGAGGGSIAWADPAGGLHVGPRSAGADPGPACYGWGGVEPTLTDANLVVGRLDPNFFLGGTMPLDVEAARAALRRLGERLGTDVGETARGVVRYALAQMARALRLVTLRRGHDPKDFVLIAYGGAGPLHASFLARELGIRTIVVPPAPGHFSAFGMLDGRSRVDAVRTHVGALHADALAQVFEALESEAAADFEEEPGPRHVERHLRLRYAGQEHSLEVPVGDGPVDNNLLECVRRDFDRRSEDAYAFSLAGPVEVVEARVVLSGPERPADWSAVPGDGAPRLAARHVDLDPYGAVRPVDVIARGSVEEGARRAGPCVIEEAAATTVVLPRQTVARDELGSLVIEEAS
jgi:N-methylhydantoinase A